MTNQMTSDINFSQSAQQQLNIGGLILESQRDQSMSTDGYVLPPSPIAPLPTFFGYPVIQKQQSHHLLSLVAHVRLNVFFYSVKNTVSINRTDSVIFGWAPSRIDMKFHFFPKPKPNFYFFLIFFFKKRCT
jgi:hypothetical protein